MGLDAMILVFHKVFFFFFFFSKHWVHVFVFDLEFSSDTSSEVGLLDHMTTLFLVF